MPRNGTATKKTIRALQAALAAEGHELPYTSVRRVWEAATGTAPESEPCSSWTLMNRTTCQWDPVAHGHLLISGRPGSGKSELLARLVRERSAAGDMVIPLNPDRAEDQPQLPELLDRLVDSRHDGQSIVLSLVGDLSQLLLDSSGRRLYDQLQWIIRTGRSTRTALLASDTTPSQLSPALRNSVGHAALAPSDMQDRFALGISDRNAELWNSPDDVLVRHLLPS